MKKAALNFDIPSLHRGKVMNACFAFFEEKGGPKESPVASAPLAVLQEGKEVLLSVRADFISLFAKEEDKKKTRSQLLKEYLRHVLENVVCYPDPFEGFQKYGLLTEDEQKDLDRQRKKEDRERRLREIIKKELKTGDI